MKKSYEKPMMRIDEFVANEYVAACYGGQCLTGYVYKDSNKNGKLDRGDTPVYRSDNVDNMYGNYMRGHGNEIADGGYYKTDDETKYFIVDGWGCNQTVTTGYFYVTNGIINGHGNNHNGGGYNPNAQHKAHFLAEQPNHS